MDRRIREIESLQALSATIGSMIDKEELIRKTTELSLTIVGADFSWIEMKDGENYILAGASGLTLDTIRKIPDSVLCNIRNEVNQNEGVLLINDLIKHKMTRGIRAWEKKAGSLMSARIQFKDKNMGILFAMKGAKFGFAEDNRGLFKAFAEQIAVALENVNLVQVTIDQEIYKEELRMAHDAQMRLLPVKMPDISGVDLDAFCMTANEIGGDFYDFIEVNEDRVDIVICDVAGKGASAAFNMAELKGVIQALAPHFTSPKKILGEVNTFIRKQFRPNMFATMIYGIYIPSKKEINLVRAGHSPAALLRKKKVIWSETRGIGLGLAADDIFQKSLEQKVIKLKKEDILVLYTDGLVEARNLKYEDYGEERLEQTLIELHGFGADEILSKLYKHLKMFTKEVSRHDDVTVVVLRIMK